MTPKIFILPDDVANHIAAGEVIERPASVVKELVENAIDAKATQITIEIGTGGKAYIRVHDNGCGMSREDAQRAFERHATSKITCTSDISAINTLGFRGEALPSIASVAKFTLLTRAEGELVGTRIDIHGGEWGEVMDAGAATGASIEVNDLFYKTPARLKFLKSPATELSYITAVITDQALAHPEIGFRVTHNAKEQLHLPAQSSLKQRIAGLFGREIVRELVEIQETAGSLEIRGFIGLPSLNRANRTYQRMFVNGRPVKDKVMSHAIQQSYDTLVPKRRHPVVFVFLTLPAHLVDVNVHPAKAEIRFVNSQTIHHVMVNAIRTTLSGALHTGYSATGTAQSEEDAARQPPQNMPDVQQRALTPPSHPPQREQGQPRNEESSPFPTSQPEAPPFPPACPVTRQSAAHLDSQGELCHPVLGGKAVFSRMKPIGQFQDTYILAQAGEELFIIDQHAAHERIYYEQLKAQYHQSEPDIQQLLFPVSFDLSHREQAVLEEHLDMLRQYGLDIEPFGGTTYLLKAVPVLLAKADYTKLIYDILDHLSDSKKTGSIEHMLDEVLMLMACHTAIRAHQRLQESQILALFRQMDSLALPYTCPHGRPTVIKINLQDLEKKFGR